MSDVPTFVHVRIPFSDLRRRALAALASANATAGAWRAVMKITTRKVGFYRVGLRPMAGVHTPFVQIVLRASPARARAIVRLLADDCATHSVETVELQIGPALWKTLNLTSWFGRAHEQGVR